ncbi:glycoside hydrolase family 20 zincin-like fold domain-containing protein [Paenibacillus sp. GCM10027626]|uniref:beta-N-acetylhexosaminidase n=1 Tax=Paenibacillus sp. GCM10027626 TaxID=3273411 RepID=UPI00363F3EFD
MKNAEEQLLLVPYPKHVKRSDSFFDIGRQVKISVPEAHKEQLYFTAQRLQQTIASTSQVQATIVLGARGPLTPDIFFAPAAAAPGEEGYQLQIEPSAIRIHYGGPAGAFHAVSTLKQLLVQYGKRIPCMTIEDAPDFAARGFMFDVSRNKVPTMDTLFSVIDTMADMKLNQLQLYIEGFSFAYDTYPYVWETGTPMTGEEIMAVDRYCRERFIELVPNQNSFGHMDAWLARKEFADLAECPGGFPFNEEIYLQAGTLDPADPRTMELVENMQDDLLPYFSSVWYNAGFDETYELGKGKNKEAADRIGTGRIYLDFLLKVQESVKMRGKKMMFWGDIVIQYPELLSELPKDAVAMEWGYEADHPFNDHAGKLHAAGMPFYVCPGTSCWNSIVGRTDNMRGNLLGAALAGKQYGASGYLNTHWYDVISLHHFPLLYAGLAYGAAVSWDVDNNRDIAIADYLNRFIFEDRNAVMGDFVLDLGNAYKQEGCCVHDSSVLGRIFHKKLDEMAVLKELTAADFERVEDYVRQQQEKLAQADMRCSEAALLDEEFYNATELLLLAGKLGRVKCVLKELDTSGGQKETAAALLEEWIADADRVLSVYKQLWLQRNRWSNGYVQCTSSGLEESAGFIVKRQSECRERLAALLEPAGDNR